MSFAYKNFSYDSTWGDRLLGTRTKLLGNNNRNAISKALDEAAEKWNNELFESQEVVAIGGWCRVANKNGRGEVYIYDNKSKDVIGTVIDGNYEA